MPVWRGFCAGIFIKLSFKNRKVIILIKKYRGDFMIYLLTHTRKLEKNLVERKYIGICSTLEKAEEKIQEYVKYEGFERFPKGFKIKKYKIDNKKENKEFKSQSQRILCAEMACGFILSVGGRIYYI